MVRGLHETNDLGVVCDLVDIVLTGPWERLGWSVLPARFRRLPRLFPIAGM